MRLPRVFTVFPTADTNQKGVFLLVTTTKTAVHQAEINGFIDYVHVRAYNNSVNPSLLTLFVGDVPLTTVLEGQSSLHVIGDFDISQGQIIEAQADVDSSVYLSVLVRRQEVEEAVL